MNQRGHEPNEPHAPHAAGGRALYSPTAWLWFLVPAVLGVALDLWTKANAFPDGVLEGVQQGRHPHEPPLTLIPSVLGFQTTVNHGAVFGLGQGYGWVFIGFSFLALGAILYVFARSGRWQFVLHLALGLITAGAIGNLYDRVRYEGVRDMLRFYVSWYPYIFNVADVLLCVGVPLLMLVWLLTKEEPGEVSKEVQATHP